MLARTKTFRTPTHCRILDNSPASTHFSTDFKITSWETLERKSAITYHCYIFAFLIYMIACGCVGVVSRAEGCSLRLGRLGVGVLVSLW